MDNQRVFAWAALALVLWLNYLAWQKDYAPAPVPAPQAQTQTPSAQAPASTTQSLPELPSASNQERTTNSPAAVTPAPEAPTNDAKVIHVRTDVLDMDISTRGGALIRADLLKYPKQKDQPNVPVRLFDPSGNTMFVARSGLRAADHQPDPTHLAQFESAKTEYVLAPGQQELKVPLTWTQDGISVTKTYTFHAGNYRIDLDYDLANHSGDAWTGASYVQIVRHFEHVERSYFNVETYAFRGPAIFDGKGYHTLKLEDEENRHYNGSFTGGWMAATQHHFVAAAVPPADAQYSYKVAMDPQNDFTVSYIGTPVTVPAGSTHDFHETLFVGPKLQEQLKAIAPNLDRTADYGWLTILARPLFYVLEKIYSLFHNWGVSIILTTFLIKLVFYRLTAASGRSMAKMRTIGPRIKAIQERYKDDREQLGRQMMEIYKKEKINPLAGCLPILIQVPFFLAFYRVLLESVEMRQAPFIGWITDLSSRDPYFILPILMGSAMFGQFKLQPMPSTDPMQAKIFAFMPIIMSVTMAWFPAGLVLYWLTNTLLSIAQQWRINKLVAAETKKN
ncbi:MAG TPA: membrane protein insertase YidC [Steroidobacteraceae bacterium]|nr:membrane protein insertase YidC [Steroidobacteraceae bacterium]